MKNMRFTFIPFMMQRRIMILAMMLMASVATSHFSYAQAVDATPDGLVKFMVNDIMSSIRSDKEIMSGNINKVIALVDTKIVPYTDFGRTTQLAMGKNWSKATPEQQKLIVTEFKTLLIRTYAGALTQVKDQKIIFKPFRMDPADLEAVVRTSVIDKGDPVQLDYRLEKVGDGWKFYDLNVLGAWLIEAYRGQFNNQINASGIDGLIKFLQDRNIALAKAK